MLRSVSIDGMPGSRSAAVSATARRNVAAAAAEAFDDDADTGIAGTEEVAAVGVLALEATQDDVAGVLEGREIAAGGFDLGVELAE